MTPASFAKTNRNLQRAIARGDIDTALNWMRVMQAQIEMTRALGDLADPKLTPRRHRQKPKAAPAQPATPTLPTMLDPHGYSPGGTPNWFLNQQRLERAGLPLSLAPQKTRRS